MENAVIHTISKSQIMAAKGIGSRSTFNNHIKKSGVTMPEWWWKERIFAGEKLIIIERIFNVSLIKKAQF